MDCEVEIRPLAWMSINHEVAKLVGCAGYPERRVIGALVGSIQNKVVEVCDAITLQVESDVVVESYMLDRKRFLATTHPEWRLLGWFTFIGYSAGFTLIGTKCRNCVHYKPYDLLYCYRATMTLYRYRIPATM
jgi:hypothetical protein